MPTIEELYQQLIALHRLTEVICVELQNAKVTCEKAGETPEAYERYFADINDILIKNSDSIITVQADTSKRIVAIHRLSKNGTSLSFDDKDFLSEKLIEIEYKIGKHVECIKVLQHAVGRRLTSFNDRITSLHKRKKSDQHLLGLGKTVEDKILDAIFGRGVTADSREGKREILVKKLNIINSLPSKMAEQVADNLLTKLATYCRNRDDFIDILKLYGDQKNLAPSLWGKLGKYLGAKGYSVFNHNVPVAKQNGPTCFFTAAATIYGHSNNVVDFPFYPSRPNDPTSRVILAPVVDKNNHYANLNLLTFIAKVRDHEDMKDWTFALRNDMESAKTYGLEPVFVSDHASETKFHTVRQIVQETGPLLWSYQAKTSGHAVVITGVAQTPKGSNYVLVVDPNLPGKTIIKPEKFLDKALKERAGHIVLFVPQSPKKEQGAVFYNNPAYDATWVPGKNVNTYYSGSEVSVAYSDSANVLGNWLQQNYQASYKGDIEQSAPFPTLLDGGHGMYAVLVRQSIEAVKQAQQHGTEAGQQIFKTFIDQNDYTKATLGMINDSGPAMIDCHQDAVFLLRYILAAQAAFEGDYQKVFEIHMTPSESLIEKHIDLFCYFYPKLKDAPAPIKETKTTKLLSVVGAMDPEAIVAFGHQTKELGRLTVQGATSAKDKATTWALVNAPRFHPYQVHYSADNLSRYLAVAGTMAYGSANHLTTFNQTVNCFADAYQDDGALAYGVCRVIRDANNIVTSAVVPACEAIGWVTSLPTQFDHWAYSNWRNFASDGCYDVLGTNGGGLFNALVYGNLDQAAYHWIKLQGHTPEALDKIYVTRDAEKAQAFAQYAVQSQHNPTGDAIAALGQAVQSPGSNHVVLFLDGIEGIAPVTSPQLVNANQEAMMKLGFLNVLPDKNTNLAKACKSLEGLNKKPDTGTLSSNR